MFNVSHVLKLAVTAALISALLSCGTLGIRPEPVPAPEPEPPMVEEPVPEAPEPAPELDEEEVYAGISAAVATGDVESAIDRFESAFSEDPDGVETRVLYGGLLMAAGEIVEAERIFDQVLEEDPENVTAMYNLSLIAGLRGDRLRQRDWLERMLELAPEDGRAHASLGELFLEQKDYVRAGESFERSLSDDPENLVALIGYGNTLLRTGEPVSAIEQFDKVVELIPDYVFAYIDRSRARAQIDDFRGAEEDLTTATALAPDFSWNYLDRGRIRLLGLNDPAGALEDFDRAIDLDPGRFLPYAYRARVRDRLGMHAEAIEDYRRVLAMRPDYHYAHPPLGILLYMDEQWEDARVQLEKAYEVDNREYGYPLLIALSYARQGRERDMRNYLNRAMSTLPRDSLFYELARLMYTPGYDAHVTALISRERDTYERYKALFYLASYHLVWGQPVTAQRFFLEVEDHAPQGVFETRLADWELDKFR